MKATPIVIGVFGLIVVAMEIFVPAHADQILGWTAKAFLRLLTLKR